MNNPTEFLEILKKANDGDPNSIRIISNIYKHHLKKILDEDIIKYVKETSHLSYSAYFLAVVYEYEEGVEQNYPKAIEIYEKVIELENAYAMNNLAFMYYNGKGVEQNYPKAIELYEKAIELGNDDAMFNLALMYDEGEGVEQNYPKAIKLYEKAIELGNAYAMNNLAFMYKHGDGVKQNYPKAIELYEKAIELENTIAMDNLALMYKHGDGVEQNYPKAIELYEKAIELENTIAMDNLIYLLKEQDMLIELAELYLKHGKKEQFTETINKIFSRTYYNYDKTKLFNLITKIVSSDICEKTKYPALFDLINYLNAHLKYSMGGEGFNESREHFTSLCNNNSIKN